MDLKSDFSGLKSVRRIFFTAFFSTVAVNLEEGSWGSRFPIIMNELYQGHLEEKNVTGAIKDLKTIKKQLKKFSPEKVVWDFENPDLLPPWKNEISSEITDLSNYFVNSDGDDFITLFMHALEKAQELKLCVNIEEL